MVNDICHIVGIDCATSSGKRGVAVATFASKCIVEIARVGSSDADITELIRDCLQQGERVLLALDAPLGWPAPLGSHLAGHKAGDTLTVSAHGLFRRETDRFVKKTFNLQPLDVGADRIARTAHSALDLLGKIRQQTGEAFTVTNDSAFARTAAIEVYPAATLFAHGLPSRGYKKTESVDVREEILRGLEKSVLRMSADARENALACADALDAVVCILAGVNFLNNESSPPENLALAAKEGWIWVKKAKDVNSGDTPLNSTP